MDRLSLRQRELRCPETLQVAASQTVTLKKADGLSWRIQYASGSTQEPGEAISPLWDYVTAASYGVEATRRLAIGVPSQGFDRSSVI